MTSQVKVVGKSGQISLGKEFAGQQVLIEELEPGEWRIRAATVVPRSQAWLHSEAMQTRLAKAIDRVQATAPKATDLGKLKKKLRVPNGK
jgi:hypothetical protein